MALPPFQALIDDHGDAVHRFLLASAGPGAADDCFQETFVSALRAYPRLRPGSNVRAWLFTIARSKAMDHHRAVRRRAVPVAEVPERVTFDNGPESPDGDLWAAVRALPVEREAGTITLRPNKLEFAIGGALRHVWIQIKEGIDIPAVAR